jgi:hypothetical protein
MNTNKKSAGIGSSAKLSALWASLMFLYIYADYISLFGTGQIEEMMAGRMGPFPVTQVSLLSAAILMLVPAVMIFLATIMKPGLNRWVNIILGALYTLVNISNLIGGTWIFYIFYGVVEIALTLLIVWHAWKLPNFEG